VTKHDHIQWQTITYSDKLGPHTVAKTITYSDKETNGSQTYRLVCISEMAQNQRGELSRASIRAFENELSFRKHFDRDRAHLQAYSCVREAIHLSVTCYNA